MPEDPYPVPESHKSDRQDSPESTKNHPSKSISPPLSDSSLSEPTVERNQQEHASGNDQEISARQQHEGAHVNSSVTQPSSENNQWHNEQKRYWERQIRISKWLNWITIGGGIIALGALGAVYGQLQMMKTSLHTTERAWVTIKAAQAKPPIATGGIPEIAIELRNSGKSPALRIKIRHMVSIKDKLPDGPMPPIIATVNENYGVGGPESSMVLHFTPTNLTNDLIALLISGKGYLFAFGTVNYSDIFEIEHETQFCFWLQDVAKIELSPCAKWNNAD